jgi:CHAT domain-containing protein
MLSEDARLLQFALGDSASFAFVLGPETAHIREVAPRQELEVMVYGLRDAIESRADRPTVLGAARRAYDALIAPVEPLLESVESLVIVPDGVLFELPFDVLHGDEVVETDSWRDVAYLGVTFETSIAPSTSVLSQLESGHHARVETELAGRDALALLAYGGPDYDHLAEHPLAPTGLDALPYAVREVERIARFAGDGGALVRTASAATEGAFVRDLRAHPARVVHLATHGLVDVAEAARSCIVLSPDPGESRARSADGYLETAEILEVRPRSALVVISACESGRGRVHRGEGVVGLGRAFFMAGVPAAVLSSWAVEDESTASFMERFHRDVLLERRSAAAALRSARQHMIASDLYAHPRHWGAFALVGRAEAPW